MKIKDLLKELKGLDPNTTIKLVSLDSNGLCTVVSEIFVELNDKDEIELYGSGIPEDEE